MRSAETLKHEGLESIHKLVGRRRKGVVDACFPVCGEKGDLAGSMARFRGVPGGAATTMYVHVRGEQKPLSAAMRVKLLNSSKPDQFVTKTLCVNVYGYSVMVQFQTLQSLCSSDGRI
jgi:hypothetical protein